MSEYCVPLIIRERSAFISNFKKKTEEFKTVDLKQRVQVIFYQMGQPQLRFDILTQNNSPSTNLVVISNYGGYNNCNCVLQPATLFLKRTVPLSLYRTLLIVVTAFDTSYPAARVAYLLIIHKSSHQDTCAASFKLPANVFAHLFMLRYKYTVPC